MADTPSIDPLKSGLVRIKREERDSAPHSKKKAAIGPSGSAEITLYPKTTAAELKAQLTLLGIKNIGKELEEAAGNNGNGTFEANELYSLDKRLESILSRSKEYFFLAAKKNPRIIVKSDRSIEPEINKWACNQLRRDFMRLGNIREIVLAAVKHYGGVLGYADGKFMGDKEIVLTAVRNGRTLKDFYGPLKKDKDINLAALRRDKTEFYNIDDSLKKDKTFMLQAIKANAQVFLPFTTEILLKKGLENLTQRFEDWCKNNISFLKKAFKQNPAVFGYIPRRFQRMFRNKYSQGLATLKILNTGRMKNMETLKEIIANRKNLNRIDRRPLAVLIYAASDWNGAFSYNKIDELIKRGYRVIYFEAKTDREAYKNLLLATAKKKADLLILAGHGTQTHLALSAGDPSKNKLENEKKYIDLSDENEMLKLRLAQCLAKGAVIILESCLNGKGRGLGNNVANLMGRVFPRATIFSSTVKTYAPNVKYLYNKENRVIGVKNGWDGAMTYVIKR